MDQYGQESSPMNLKLYTHSFDKLLDLNFKLLTTVQCWKKIFCGIDCIYQRIRIQDNMFSGQESYLGRIFWR